MDRIVVPGYVRARQFDDELVILDLEGGSYFALRDVGVRIWQSLADGRTPAEVAATLVGEFDVEQETLLEDCLRLVEELIARRLVTWVSR